MRDAEVQREPRRQDVLAELQGRVERERRAVALSKVVGRRAKARGHLGMFPQVFVGVERVVAPYARKLAHRVRSLARLLRRSAESVVYAAAAHVRPPAHAASAARGWQ